jgi:hypothetical protein
MIVAGEHRMRPAVLLATLAIVILAGCVADRSSVVCSADTVTLELTLTADSLTPDDPAACRDQDVTLRVAPEADGFLHIHGYDDQVPATEVTAGEETVIEFTASRSGQYPIEFHPADDPEGVSVGILTIDER